MASRTESLPPDSDAELAYEFLRRLGQGASGEVYLATDRATGEQLAIKRLLRMDPKTVLRLKREFRALADLDHPNLIKLYDLLRARDGFLLVMEYVDGVELGTHVAQLPEGAQRGATLATTFHQLATGVQALHDAGVLHRDLKPSNVLVGSERVVLLDFGLVRELEGSASLMISLEQSVAGTPAYMAPEQAAAEPLSAASDWYAVGVMLYEALSGKLPIQARHVTELLRLKLTEDPEPPPPDPDVPADLASLCMEMLQRDPSQRPRGNEIIARLAVLGTQPLHRPTRPPGRSAADAQQLVGRDAELQKLRAALRLAEHQAVVVHVSGGSGAGKSALIEQFIDDVEASSLEQHDVWVLRSRCYEREAMPFKALDGLIDGLVVHLSKLDDIHVAHMVPGELAELTQVFPMFERNNAVRRLLGGKRARGGATEIRERAERGLRDMLKRVGKNHVPVIVIDDLHWGDLDSAGVIVDWLREPFWPLLLILSYRSDEVETSSCLRAILNPSTPLPPTDAKVSSIELSPLSDTDVQALCRARSDAQQLMPDAVVSRIVREARGNPFLAQQLTALARARLDQGDGNSSALSLGELVTELSELLSQPARALLDVLAIAGRPLLPSFALSVANVTQEGRGLIHTLQALHLLRMRDVRGERQLEIYHDRVREAVSAALSPEERIQVHRSLLDAAQRSTALDAHWLHVLALGAGERQAALHYGRLAAEHATASLAFERAAALYRACLDLCDAPDASAELWAQLALALARCKRGVKAAEAYVHATEHMSPERAVPLLRLAAAHFLRSGRFEEGDLLVQKVLHTLKLDAPTTKAGLFAAIGWEISRQALRGDRFVPRVDAESSEASKLGLLFGTLAIETLNHAPLRAVYYQARAQRYASESGNPALLARTLCLTATMSCISGTPRAARRANGMLARAAELARELGNTNSRLDLELCSARAICSMLLGRPKDVLEAAYAAGRIYETRSNLDEQGEYYYMFAVHAARIGALQNLGRYPTASLELAKVIERAKASDNRGALLLLTVPVTLAEQMAEQCSRSRERLSEERKLLPEGEFALVQLQHLIAVMRAACLTDDYAWALPIVERDWPRYLDSTVYRGAYMAYLAHTTHARLLLNRHVHEGSRDPSQLVQADLRRLERLPRSAFTLGSLCRHRARLAVARGDRETAIGLLRQSADAYGSVDFQDDAARERYALGTLLGGAEGAQLVAVSLARLRELGCSDPVAEVHGYYPELFRRS